jgi:cyclic pyranopterin phosphate synthase
MPETIADAAAAAVAAATLESVPAKRRRAQRVLAERISADPAPLQALTDSFGRRHSYLRISLTERCNLRCTYCMPKEGVELSPAERMLSDDEVLRLASLFASQGVTKIRLTGGEPLLRRGIEALAGKLKQIPGVEELGITTNGMLLERKLPALVEAGVDALNVSLDTLVPAKFSFITRRPTSGMARVLSAVDAAIQAGVPSVKLNCVVMRGMNEEELADFVRLTETRPLEVRFIEYMPFNANRWDDSKLVRRGEMLESIRAGLETSHGLQAAGSGLERLGSKDRPGDVSKTYAVPGWAGRVGFITSMSDHFCGDCNRLRLTADGNLKTCLFGTDETDLRGRMRAGQSDAELLPTIASAVGRKKAVLGGHNDVARLAENAGSNRAMIHIGG